MRGRLSEKARRHKIEYNMKRNKELYKLFGVKLPKEEYALLCDYLKSINMNKAEFIRWAFDRLREN